MPKPDKPPKPDWEDEVLRLLQEISEQLHTVIQVLKKTEENNERRHKELLKVLEGKDASRIVFTKIRREPIP